MNEVKHTPELSDKSQNHLQKKIEKQSLQAWKLSMQLNQAHVGYQGIIRELSQKCGEYDKYFYVDDRDKDAGVWPIIFRSELVFPEGIIKNSEARHAFAAHKACSGIPTEALEAGVIGELVQLTDTLWRLAGNVDADNCNLLRSKISPVLAKLEGK